MAKTVAIIPSRLESSRVHRKPLADIVGMPMVAHVYHRASLSPVLDDVLVATDSDEVKSAVEKWGGKAVITSSTHRNGTERLAEASKDMDADLVVLVNGDEALLNPEYIKTSVDALTASTAQASILVNRFQRTDSPSDFKVVLNLRNEVMYISRGDIPCNARHPVPYRLKAYHIMAFRRDFPPGLRGAGQIAHGSPSRTTSTCGSSKTATSLVAAEVDSTAVSVDTPRDLEFAREQMPADRFFRPLSATFCNQWALSYRRSSTIPVIVLDCDGVDTRFQPAEVRRHG